MWQSGLTEVLVITSHKVSFIESLREISPRLHFQQVNPASHHEVSKDQWAEIDILITDGILPKPENAPNLKWVQFTGTYDLDQLVLYKSQNKRVVFTSTDGLAAANVAEFCLRQMLTLSQMPRIDPPSTKKLKGLSGATVGLIGYDSNNRELARLLQPFHCTLLASTFNAMNPEATTYACNDTGDPDGRYFHRLYPMQALGSMLGSCDYIVNGLNASTLTNNSIKANHLNQLKSTARFVDISDPGITDLRALYQTAAEHKIAAVAIDILKKYYEAKLSDLQPSENIIITFGQARKYLFNAVCFTDLLKENFTRFFDGNSLLNIIV
jgi:phosphoglycerate dehydrogenase-like enzyme